MAYSDRRKQMLNWARTASSEKWVQFDYQRWIRRTGETDIIAAIKKATEDELDDLYILREELRLGI